MTALVWTGTVVLSVLLLFGYLLAIQTEETPEYTLSTRDMETISFLVDESDAGGGTWKKIVGNYWHGTKKDAVILIHMMPATKESWNTFSAKLNEGGYHVLAIDLRGHGESTEYFVGGDVVKLDYKQFSDAQHGESIRDIEGAQKWLMGTSGVGPENIYIGGASIGANLAINHLWRNPKLSAAFLLSPGLDYKGITTKAPMVNLATSQKVFLIAADDDAYSADSVRSLGDMAPSSNVTFSIYPSGGHGTAIFDEHTEVMDEIITWLSG